MGGGEWVWYNTWELWRNIDLERKKERMINDRRIWHVTKGLKWIYTFRIKVKDQMGKEINKGECYIYVGCHSREAQSQKQY